MALKLTALVIDDSAYNRRAIADILTASGEVTVVGRCADGEEGLREALRLNPDFITLDLEMPRMDGFTFLRILMARQPTPIIVISSYARRANVFRALELGAVDFVAKPTRFLTEEIEQIRGELLEKVRTVRSLRRDKLVPRPAPGKPAPRLVARSGGPFRVVAIGASTGGPPALQLILPALPRDLSAAVVVVQHMPERFTRAFADRLDKACAVSVKEAEHGDVLEPGRVLLAPGGKRLEVVADGADLKIALKAEQDTSRHVPSIDVLFETLARLAGPRCLGVVLTGMGRDGRAGSLELKERGGSVIAESEATAVVFGMPKEAIESGSVDQVLPLGDIAAAIAGYAQEGALPGARGR